jgi:ribonuclease D
MINYARMDTHYLIYCYEQLKMKLSKIVDPKSQKTAIHTTFDDSQKITYMVTC